jgi:ankyrin repeat protein
MDLIDAVYRKNYTFLSRLFDSGINIDFTDDDGRSLVMHAVLAEQADSEMINFLVDRGADVNLTDKAQKWTALHFAARDQKVEMVETLIQRGAQIDPKDSFGNTPLWRCVMNTSPNLRIVQTLVRAGANPNSKNNNDVSPLDVARLMDNKEVIEIMSSKG